VLHLVEVSLVPPVVFSQLFLNHLHVLLMLLLLISKPLLVLLLHRDNLLCSSFFLLCEPMLKSILVNLIEVLELGKGLL